MADYPLRDVPDDLWKKVKVKAAQEGKPIRTVILELLTKYVK
jgi:plasmid stability protein